MWTLTEGADQPCGLTGHLGQFGRIDQHRRVAAGELHAELLDIGIAPAERGRQRQRHGPAAGIDHAEEQGREIRAGLGDQRDAVLGLDAGRNQTARHGQRIVTQFRIGVGPGQRAARVMEVETTHACGGIIQRLAERCEVGQTARQRIFGRRREKGRLFRQLFSGIRYVDRHNILAPLPAALIRAASCEACTPDVTKRSKSVPTVAQ